MIEILKEIIANVLTALYQPFIFAVILAFLFMFFYLFVKEHGIGMAFRKWWNGFKSEPDFGKIFFLTFYTTMILFRTLLNRSMWANPVSNVIGVWGLYNENNELTTEAIENLALFIPFAVLLLCSLKNNILKGKVKFASVLWQSTKIVFLFSLTIEFMQLFFRLGTFQLSDLFYNTLGGLIGGLIYWIGYKITYKKQ